MITLSKSLASITAGVFAALLLVGCGSTNDYGDGIFSYSKDRCLGSHNQCRNECASAPDPNIQSACIQRCQSSQSQCYAMGDDGRGSSLAQDSLIDRAKTRAEKEEAYESYKAGKTRERAEADADEDIVE